MTWVLLGPAMSTKPVLHPTFCQVWFIFFDRFWIILAVCIITGIIKCHHLVRLTSCVLKTQWRICWLRNLVEQVEFLPRKADMESTVKSAQHCLSIISSGALVAAAKWDLRSMEMTSSFSCSCRVMIRSVSCLACWLRWLFTASNASTRGTAPSSVPTA